MDSLPETIRREAEKPENLRNGQGHPVPRRRRNDEDAELFRVFRNTMEEMKKPAADEVPVEVPPLERDDGLTEGANARRLVEKHADRLRWVREWKQWVVWEGDRWRRDVGGDAAEALAQEVVGDLWDFLAHPPVELADYYKQRIVKHAAKSDSAQGVLNMLRLARGLLPIHVSELDADPWKLNVANGTLDLKTGRLWAHRQNDYLTKLCPTAYVPDAECPTWLRFLGDVFQRAKDLTAYLQRLLGYGLTGDVSEQQLPIFWGKGSNGKSTLVETVLHTVGTDYAGAPPRDLFVVHRQGRHPTELMTLHGKRLMMAQETDAGVQLNEALIKHLTGGDTVTGRGVYENFVSFAPTHKLLLSTNHKPKVRGTDYAVWRRLKLLPFLVQFAGDNRDPQMKEKLKAEAEGVLAWMVRGCLDWQRDGMGEPEAVRLATESYATEQDLVGRFLRDCCEQNHKYVVGSTVLLQAFKAYLPDNGMSDQAFWDELDNRGFAADRFKSGPNKNRGCRKGVRLRPEPQPAGPKPTAGSAAKKPSILAAYDFPLPPG